MEEANLITVRVIEFRSFLARSYLKVIGHHAL